jgi:hypothetical protein
MFLAWSSKRSLGLVPIFGRLRVAVAWLRQAWLETRVETTLTAIELGLKLGANRKSRLLTTGAIGLALGLRGGVAQAGTTTGDACGGTSGGATSSITRLFQNIGVLLYIIGGIFSLVCFAGAALMMMGIVFPSSRSGKLGDPHSQHDRAMRWAKHTLWGLALLAGGFFLRSIAVHSMLDSNQVESPGLGQQGATADLTNCGIPQGKG